MEMVDRKYEGIEEKLVKNRSQVGYGKWIDQENRKNELEENR